LSNVEKVTVRGAEIDSAFRPNSRWFGYLTLSYTNGRYESFKNGPPPLEFLTATTAAYDLSGKRLPGVSEWAGSFGFEYRKPITIGKIDAEGFVGVDTSWRSDWYSDPSVSEYSKIEGSSLTKSQSGFQD